VTAGEGLKNVATLRLGWGKFRFGSETCDMAHSLVERMARRSRRLGEYSPRRLEPSALTQGAKGEASLGRKAAERKRKAAVAPKPAP
jgi:hypothetical protein